jgi:chromosome segregation ATPase
METMTSSKRLAHSLETLAKELSVWVAATRDFDITASHALKQEEEAVLRAEQQIKIMAHQYTYNQELGKKVDETFAATHVLCRETLYRTQETFTQVQGALVQINMLLDRAQKELAQTKTWLKQAQERLITAKTELQRTQTRFSHTMYVLQDAQEALLQCRNDTSLRRCFGEAIAVQRSQTEMEQAQAAMFIAERELHDATAQEMQAQNRVTPCMQAVEFIEEAVDMAHVTIHNAEQSVNDAQQSLECIEAVRKLLQETQHGVNKEAEIVEKMIRATRVAKTHIDEARRQATRAAGHEDVAVASALQAQKGLQRRVEQLRLLDHPQLEESAPAVEKRVEHSRPKIVPFLGGLLSLRIVGLKLQNLYALPLGENDREILTEGNEYGG